MNMSSPLQRGLYVCSHTNTHTHEEDDDYISPLIRLLWLETLSFFSFYLSHSLLSMLSEEGRKQTYKRDRSALPAAVDGMQTHFPSFVFQSPFDGYNLNNRKKWRLRLNSRLKLSHVYYLLSLSTFSSLTASLHLCKCPKPIHLLLCHSLFLLLLSKSFTLLLHSSDTLHPSLTNRSACQQVSSAETNRAHVCTSVCV